MLGKMAKVGSVKVTEKMKVELYSHGCTLFLMLWE